MLSQGLAVQVSQRASKLELLFTGQIERSFLWEAQDHLETAGTDFPPVSLTVLVAAMWW